MLFTPTNTIPGNFDAVSSEEIQNMVKKDLAPIPGAARTGRYSIIFTLEGKPDVEWKYSSSSDRNTDYDAVIAAANAGGSVTVPNLQQVTDEGATTTADVTVNSISDSEGTISSLFSRFNLSSTDILGFNIDYTLMSSPEEESEYYDVEAIYLEFTAGTTAYTMSSDIYITGAYNCVLPRELITSSTPGEKIVVIARAPIDQATGGVAIHGYSIANAPLKIGGGGVAPAAGDGTMRIVVKYKTRLFGQG
jgi:hypothetical protein